MRYRDFIQNITITLLTLSAVFLFSRTQFFQLGAAAGSGYWQHLTAPIGSGETDTALSDRLLAPVRLAGLRRVRPIRQRVPDHRRRGIYTGEDTAA